MSLKVFEEPDVERWNHILDSSAGATIFHRWEWLKIAEKHSRSKLYPLVYFDDGGHPFGMLPLFHSKRGPLKMAFSPPPGCAMRLGPIIVVDGMKQHKLEHICNEFQSQVDQFIGGLGANYVLLNTSPGLEDARPFIWSNYDVTPDYNYSIDLTHGMDAVWGGFKKGLRKDIIRTERRGVSIVERTSDENIEYLYDSLDRRFEVQRKTFPFSRQYLYDLFQQFRTSNLKLFVALYEDRVVGASLHTTYRDTMTAWVGSTKSDISGLAVNDLIKWEAIKWAIENGYKRFELMGADDYRLCKFKSKYSPKLELVFNIKKADPLGRLAERFYLGIYRKIKLRNSL